MTLVIDRTYPAGRFELALEGSVQPSSTRAMRIRDLVRDEAGQTEGATAADEPTGAQPA